MCEVLMQQVIMDSKTLKGDVARTLLQSSWFPSQELGFVAPNSTKEVANKTLVQTFSRLQCRLCDSKQNHQIVSYFIFGQCILPHFAAKRKAV